MANCPHCSNEVKKPSKLLKNRFFSIEVFDCEKCHTNFKITDK
jgi:hypothetical protein